MRLTRFATRLGMLDVSTNTRADDDSDQASFSISDQPFSNRNGLPDVRVNKARSDGTTNFPIFDG